MAVPAPQTRRVAVLKRLRGSRYGLVFALAAISLALIPWTAYLSATLPGEHLAQHWDVAWGGFDAFELVALTATLVALVRRSPRLPVFAAIAGTSLLTDAWFDLWTASPGRDRSWALVMAILGELPLAVLCFWIAYDSADALVSAAATTASGAGPPATSPPDRPGQGQAPARTADSEAPSGGRTSR